MQNFRARYLPKGSHREKIARRFYYLARDLLRLGPVRRIVNRLIESTGVFVDRYLPEDFGYTILYTDQERLFPEYPYRETIAGPRRQIKVSLIATLRNEANNVREWMECIYRQSRLPDEIIIVDGGSSDGAQEVLKTLAETSPVPIKILCEKDLNISRGRNLAIAQAAYPFIAATDFGCRPEEAWLEMIIAPFERDEQIQMVGGWYTAIDRQGRILRRGAWPTLEQVDPAGFIPSSRSIAFTKDTWEKANGYPEWLTLTGEDTYFALELRKFSSRRAFVPDAIVRWFAPGDLRGYWKKIALWSVGDGESGLHGSIYLSIAKQILFGAMLILSALALLALSIWFNSIPFYLFTLLIFVAALLGVLARLQKQGSSIYLLIAEIGVKVAQAWGFLKGMRRRKEVDLRRFKETKGIYFILAGVPIHDTGGGSRGAQIALEMVRQNYLVVYLNKFDSYESVNLGLRFSHPNLLLWRFSDFSWENFSAEYAEILAVKSCRALLEFPLEDFLPLIYRLHKIEAVVIYDLLDDWDTQLGSTWYKEEVEQEIISSSDVLIATAPVLVERLEKKSGRPVAYLPNAVNLRLFNSRRAFLRPEDLPQAKKIITYIGALWGDWFDWDLLVDIARDFPEAAVVVIGDYRGQCPATLPNLYFLGLKLQSSLPGYLANSQAAIIPWKENEITYATSPLKLYEYLAMRVPVVVPDLPPLKDIPFVYRSGNPKEFVENIRRAMNMRVDPAEIDRYIHAHSWEQRVKQLDELLTSKISESV